LLGLVCALSLSTPSLAEVRYDVIRLVEGDAVATGLNERGDVVGTINSLVGGSEFWIWRDGVMERHTLPFAGRPNGIDNLGRVVGSFYTGEKWRDDVWNEWYLVTHAFQWVDGRITDLGTLGGWDSWATWINDQGVVLGAADDSGMERLAFVWKEGPMRALQSLVPAEQSAVWQFELEPHYVASDGRIWGPAKYLRRKGYVYELVPQEDGSYRILNRGLVEGFEPRIRAFNELGQAVGVATYSRFDEPLPWAEIFIQDEHGTRRLGRLRHNATYPRSVNNFEQIVGMHDGASYRAFLWDHGVMHELNDLVPSDSGLVLVEGVAINDAGQIVCAFRDTDTNRYGSCLLNPRDPSPLEIRELRWTIEGLRFEVWGGGGRALCVEYSTNLTTWNMLAASSTLFGRRTFLDPEGTRSGFRAYRARVITP
jgi:probable HAF family extracellular repeat protein